MHGSGPAIEEWARRNERKEPASWWRRRWWGVRRVHGRFSTSLAARTPTSFYSGSQIFFVHSVLYAFKFPKTFRQFTGNALLPLLSSIRSPVSRHATEIIGEMPYAKPIPPSQLKNDRFLARLESARLGLAWLEIALRWNAI